MPTNSKSYTRKVINEAGSVLLFPETSESPLRQALDADPYAISAIQLFPLGTKLVRGERTYRYALNGGTGLAAGAPVQGAAALNAAFNADVAMTVPAATPATAGTFKISVTSTATLASNSSAGTFNEGYLVVNDQTGKGSCYKIKDQPAFSGTSQNIITLYDPLAITLDATSQLGFIQNPYKNVIATAAVLTGAPLGVAPRAVTASYYFWLQTGGVAAVATHTTIAVGGFVMVGTTAAQVDPAVTDVKTYQIIGYALTPGVSTAGEMFLVFLILD